MHATLAFAFGLAALAMSTGARADPVLECRVLAGNDIAVRDCLRAQLDISYRAMSDAQELARGAARQIDDRAGREFALRGVEASQHAWEAYRDVECKTNAMFAAESVPAETAQLACEIRLTRERTDVLLRFASRGD